MKRTITCVGCGETVTKKIRGKGLYCSLECYRTGKRPTRVKNHIIKKKCKSCKKIYETKRKSQQFCSVECHNKWQGRNKVKFICKTCEQEFLWSPSRVARGYKPIYCSIPCRNADEDYRAKLRELNLRQINKKGLNKLEREGRKILEELGIPFLEQHYFNKKFVVDVFVPDKNLVIQWDGDYWHGRKKTNGQLDGRQIKRMKLDKSQDAYMKKCGIDVLRFWESDVYNNRKEVYDNIRRTIQ